MDLQTLPGTLRRHLLIATQGRQLVWDYNTYSRPFVLKGPGKPGAGPPSGNGDPSRIIELTNTFAFAREKGLLLPAGLIAYRPPAGSPHAQKVGGYQHDHFAGVGNGWGIYVQPMIDVVLTVDGDTAEVLSATKEWRTGKGTSWRVFPGVAAGDRINWQDTVKMLANELKWRDANSGTYHSLPTVGVNLTRVDLKTFKRLDG